MMWMKNLVRAVASALAILLLGSCSNVTQDTHVTLTFLRTAGLSLTQELLNQSLRSPEFQIKLAYKPLIGIPGLSAAYKRCGFLNLPCFNAVWKEKVLPSTAIRISDKNKIEFRLPAHTPGPGFYSLDSMELVIPTPWHYHQPGRETMHFRFESGAPVKPQVVPIQAEWGPYVVQGTARLGFGKLRLQDNNAVQSIGCSTDIQMDANGTPVFSASPQIWSYYKFVSAFEANDWLVDKTPDATRRQLTGPPPALLASFTPTPIVFYTSLLTAAGLFEAIRVRPPYENEGSLQCARYLRKELLFLDGKLVRYSNTIEHKRCADKQSDYSAENVDLWEGQVEKYHRLERRNDRESTTVFWHRLGHNNGDYCGPKPPPSPPQDRVDAALADAQQWRALFPVASSGAK